MRSRLFCALLLLTLSGTGINSPAASSAQEENTPKVVWHSVSDWDIEGGAWPVDELAPSHARLPSKAGRIVPGKVWNLSGIDPGIHTCMAYFPLRNSLLDVSLGVPRGAKFQPVAPRSEKPIVFYGTSITHGACASRPGMSHVAILGGRLNLPMVNLSLAGNGTMDPKVGALLTELDAAVYVIDCLPNMNGDQVAEKTEPLVKQLRQARPDTPIVLVEDRSFSNSWRFKSRRDHHEKSRSALVRAYDNLVSYRMKAPYCLGGEDLLGDDTEATTGGSHPSDFGFLRQAKAFKPLLKQAIGAIGLN